MSEIVIDDTLLEDESFKASPIYSIGEIFKQTLLEFHINENQAEISKKALIAMKLETDGSHEPNK